MAFEHHVDGTGVDAEVLSDGGFRQAGLVQGDGLLDLGVGELAPASGDVLALQDGRDGLTVDVELGGQFVDRLTGLVAGNQLQLVGFREVTLLLDDRSGWAWVLRCWESQQPDQVFCLFRMVQVRSQDLHPKTSSHNGFIARLDPTLHD